MAIDFFKMLFYGKPALIFSTWLSLFFLFIGFIVCLCLTIFKRGYSIKNRLWFIIVGVGSIIFQIVPCITYNNFQTLLIVLSAFVFCVAILSAFPVREIKVSPSHKQFINKLKNTANLQIEQTTLEEIDEQSEDEMKESLPPLSKVKSFFEEDKKPTQKKVSDIDFSHVKKIIARLKEMELSPSDKKQIFELENNINQAEFIEYTPAIKSKINSGLGAVLKIMSKYGA